MQPDAGSDFATHTHSCAVDSAELHSYPLPNNSNAIDGRGVHGDAIHGDAIHGDAILRTNSIADAEVRRPIGYDARFVQHAETHLLLKRVLPFGLSPTADPTPSLTASPTAAPTAAPTPSPTPRCDGRSATMRASCNKSRRTCA